MALYKNASEMNQFIEEHRRTIGPNEELELTDDDLKLRSYSKGISSGWLIPLEELDTDVEDTTVADFETKLDDMVEPKSLPLKELTDTDVDSLSSAQLREKIIQDAVDRAEIEKQEALKNAAIERALGGYDEENIYVHRPVLPGSYGNPEQNNSPIMTKMTTPPGLDEDITYPSAVLEETTNKMVANQMKMQMNVPSSQVHLKKEATKSPKVIPPTKVVKTPKK